jgi:hypothetical protein
MDNDDDFPGFSGGRRDAQRRHMAKYEAAAASGNIWEMAYLEWYINSWYPHSTWVIYMDDQRSIARKKLNNK